MMNNAARNARYETLTEINTLVTFLRLLDGSDLDTAVTLARFW